MAGPLAAIERFFERILERPAARLFQAKLEPIHLQRQLERVMEAERRLGSSRTYVPNSYRVYLHPADLLAFDSYRDSLAADLGESLHDHARRRGYTLTARPQVELVGSPEVAAGDIVVRSQGVQLASDDGRVRVPGPSATADALPPASPPPGESPASPPPATPPAATLPPSGQQAGGTSVYATPKVEMPRAVLAVHVQGRSVWRVPVTSGTLRVGRALDNDLILPDDRVSRHHGQFGVRFGTLVYTDLGSTNGSFLNGSAVTEIALGPGDILQLGASTLAIEQG